MGLRIFGSILTAFVLSSCAAPKAVQYAGPDCRPWKAKAVVQCWWPGPAHPLTSCELTTRSYCPFDDQAVAALAGDTSVILDTTRYPGGTWAWFDVFQDDAGRVGRASFKGEAGTILVKP